MKRKLVSRIRDKNEVTIPIPVREHLNLNPDDLVVWNIDNRGIATMGKLITHRVPVVEKTDAPKDECQKKLLS